MVHHPARAAVQDSLHQLTGLRFGGPGFNAAEVLLFFGSTLAVALAVTDLGTIFRLVGGTGGSVLIFTMPGLLLMQYAYSKHVQSRRGAAAAAALAAEWLPAPAGGGAAAAEEGGAAAAAAAAEAAPGAGPGAPGAGPQGVALYSFWASKLWWSGVLLVLLSAALCFITVYTIVSPPAALQA